MNDEPDKAKLLNELAASASVKLTEQALAGFDYGGDYMPNSRTRDDAIAAVRALAAALEAAEARIRNDELIFGRIRMVVADLDRHLESLEILASLDETPEECPGGCGGLLPDGCGCPPDETSSPPETCGCGHPVSAHDRETGWCRICEDDHASNPEWLGWLDDEKKS
jgi:hypothetical protein